MIDLNVCLIKKIKYNWIPNEIKYQLKNIFISKINPSYHR